MSIEFDCDKCGKLSDRYIILCPTCATGNTVGTQPTYVQQLKAEILPILNEALESLRLGDLDEGENLINQVTAKLSAV